LAREALGGIICFAGQAPSRFRPAQLKRLVLSMHPDLEALATKLEDAAAFLRGHMVDNWADWLSKDAALIRSRDFYGVEHLLSAFGGMGSLNDIGLEQPSPINPNVFIASADDFRIQSLLTEIHALATKLSREEHRATRRT
jgi:hypothetical protein